MKKVRWILVGAIILVLAAGVAVVLKRDPTGDNLASITPYITKERVIYYDPAEMMKSLGTAAASMPAGNQKPVMVRIIKVSNIAFPQLKKLIQHDLTAAKGWNFAPWPPSGVMSKSSPIDMEMLVAYQGKPLPTGTTPGVFSAFGFGAGADPDHMIMVLPDFSAWTMSGAKPETHMKYMVMEQKKLSTLEVLWLKAKHLGKSPFSTQKEMMDFGNDF